MKVVANCSFQEWNDMISWQRSDFIGRYKEYQKEQERQIAEYEHKMQALIPKGK